jgi:flagellar basal-body rod modification protein FlgD
MTTTPVNGTSTNPVGITSTQTPSSSASSTDPLASKDVFLQLLVAQLKYQDPLNPADGTQFVTQLATFSGVEQSTQMRDDLDAIRQALTASPAASAAGSGNSSTGAGAGSSSSSNGGTNSINGGAGTTNS